MSTLPKGIHPIIYALFNEAGELDRDAMRRQVEICVEQGARGLLTLGLATEVRELSPQQRRQIVEWNAADLAGRIPLGVTIFAANPDEQLEEIAHAKGAGAAWVVVQPTAVATNEGTLVASFAHVLAKSALPAALQNVPQFLGVGLSVESIAKLSEAHPTLIGMKQEVSATETSRLVGLVGDRLQIFSGRGGMELIDGYKAGIAGNVPAPEYVDHLTRIWDLMEAGKETEARQLYAEFLPVATFILQSLDALVTYGKALFCLRHGLPFHPRQGAPLPTAFGLAALEGHARHIGIDISTASIRTAG